MNERGSMAPVFIGLVVCSIAALLVTVSATSMLIFQKRLTGLAEGAALWSEQTGLPAQEFLNQINTSDAKQIWVRFQGRPDGITTAIELCSEWKNPISLPWIISSSQICSHASARNGA